MNSRERVLATLSRKEPDKVPIDCGGTICSTMTRTAHNAVKAYLGIGTPDEPITHPVLDTVVPCDELLQRFQVDFRAVRMRPPSNIGAGSSDKQGFSATSAAVIIQPRGHTFSDEFGTVWQKADNDYAPVRYAYANATLAELKTAKWPDPYGPGRVQGLKEEARHLSETTDLAIVGDIMCGGPFEQALWRRRRRKPWPSTIRQSPAVPTAASAAWGQTLFLFLGRHRRGERERQVTAPAARK